MPSDLAPLGRRVLEKMLALVGAFHKAGVPIVAGSDQAVPGHSLHREIELYVRAGFTPMEAIQAATLVPAQVMGVEKEVGTIEITRRADLILLDASPLDDIHNIRTVRYVVANGVLYPTAKLWRASASSRSRNFATVPRHRAGGVKARRLVTCTTYSSACHLFGAHLSAAAACDLRCLARYFVCNCGGCASRDPRARRPGLATLSAAVVCSRAAQPGWPMKMRGNTLVWIAARSFAAIALVFALSGRADACDCGVPGPCQALSFADAVFTGVVTDISPVLTPDGNGVTGFTTTLAADRSFVGRTGTGTVTLTAKLSSCDFQFRVGERYLVYARRASDGSLTASSCSRTKLLTDADEDLAFLTSLSPIGTGGQLSGLVERVQIDLLGVHHGENLSAAAVGVSLTISGPQEVRREVVTDGNGRFHAAGLPPGDYRIAVNVPQTIRVQGELEVRLADRGCAVSGIHLIANGRVSGRVIDRLGDAVPRAVISLMPAAFTNREEFPHVWIRAQASDARGEFAFDGLPAGEYHLGVNVMFGASPSSPYAPVWLPGVDARAETVPVRLSEGGRRSGLEIVLGDKLREIVIHGIVLLADGSAAGGAQVALLSPGSRIATAINRADVTGAFELKALEKTAYVLEASLTGPSGKRMSATASVNPTPDEPVFLRMVLTDVATPSNRHQR